MKRLKKTLQSKPNTNNRKGNEIKKIILTEIIPTIVVMYIVFGVVFKVAVVNGESMYPTLHENEIVIFTSLSYKTPERGDIIYFKENGQNYIKRVIGVEGDKIDIDFNTGAVYINDIELSESYINEPTNKRYDVEFPIVVGTGEVFVMGDNRNHSLDSRSSKIGLVNIKSIKGKFTYKF